MRITVDKNVVSVYEDVCARWERWYLLMSDIHHDSVYCNRELETAHLNEALARNAQIIMLGDIFDAMQGRFDPRRSMVELRPEYRREDYYDFIVRDLGDYLAPYAKNILLIGRGNHETAVLKNANTDLIDRLAFYLNSMHGGRVVTGGFGGWVRFMFEMLGVPNMSYALKYFHGAGSEAPVTRGVIQTNRQAVYLPDADVVVNGHNHNLYYVPICRERLSGKGQPYQDIQHHVRIPGYKQEYADGSGGWTVERGGVPKPIGAVWMRMYYDSSRSSTARVHLQFIADIEGGLMVEPVGVGDGAGYVERYPEP